MVKAHTLGTTNVCLVLLIASLALLSFAAPAHRVTILLEKFVIHAHKIVKNAHLLLARPAKEVLCFKMETAQPDQFET